MKSLSGFANFSQATNKPFYAGALVFLRIVLGVQFFAAGVAKFGDWSAEGYLLGATGPFAGFFQSLAGNPLVDFLNLWGLLLIGLALILGVFVRPASLFGGVLMLLYFFAHFEQNTEHGLIEYHIIYTIIFICFLAGGVGHVFGLDGLISRNMRKRRVLAKLLFG